jgi:hypothetical protein
VNEIYGEVLIPILSGLPFAEELNIEAGYRLSDYDIDSVGTSAPTRSTASGRRPTGCGSAAVTSGPAAHRTSPSCSPHRRRPGASGHLERRRSVLARQPDRADRHRQLLGQPDRQGLRAHPWRATRSATPTAAKVETLCRQIMNADGNGGGDVYYRTGRTYNNSATGFDFPTLSATRTSRRRTPRPTRSAA